MTKRSPLMKSYRMKPSLAQVSQKQRRIMFPTSTLLGTGVLCIIFKIIYVEQRKTFTSETTAERNISNYTTQNIL